MAYLVACSACWALALIAASHRVYSLEMIDWSYVLVCGVLGTLVICSCWLLFHSGRVHTARKIGCWWGLIAMFGGVVGMIITGLLEVFSMSSPAPRNYLDHVELFVCFFISASGYWLLLFVEQKTSVTIVSATLTE